MSKYWSERAAHLKRFVTFPQGVAAYGLHLDTTRDMQFSCPLHGRGHDASPSARYYTSSDSSYCFTCQKARDVIQWVSEREGLPWVKALVLLEERHAVPPFKGEWGEGGQGPSKIDHGKSLGRELEGPPPKGEADLFLEGVEYTSALLESAKDHLGTRFISYHRVLDYLRQDLDKGRLSPKEGLNQIARIALKLKGELIQGQKESS